MSVDRAKVVAKFMESNYNKSIKKREVEGETERRIYYESRG